MRKALTLVQYHGEKDLRVLTDSSVPIETQKQEFKKLQRGDREHPEYARIELWTSSNCAKSHKFRKPKESPESTPEPEPEPEPENLPEANAGAGEQTTKKPKGTTRNTTKG